MRVSSESMSASCPLLPFFKSLTESLEERIGLAEIPQSEQ